MLGLSVALYGIARTFPQDSRSAWIIGAGLAWAFLSRPTALAPAVLVALYILFRDRIRFLYLAFGALPFAAFWCGFAWRVYGSPFKTGYALKGGADFVPDLGASLWGTFFDESRGIFVYSPFLLIGLAGFWFLLRALRRRLPGDEPLATIAVFALSALPITAYIAAIGQFPGGWSYGYRSSSECGVLLLPAFALLVEHLWPRWFGKAVLVAVVSVAVGIHALEWAFPNDVWNARDDLKSTPQIVVHLKFARYRLGL